MVHKAKGRRERKLKLMYSNVNGVTTVSSELNEYLRRKDPDIVGLTETKLDKSFECLSIGDGKYNMWIKSRKNKQGGGVMILTKKDLQVDEVVYGRNNVELIKVGIRSEGKPTRNFAVIYVPPKTRAWNNIEHRELLIESRLEMNELIRHCGDLTVLGDFNCKEVNWEEFTTDGGEESWGSEVLNLAVENTLTQWVVGNTRFRGDDEPSRLDLVFTKDPESVEDITYECQRSVRNCNEGKCKIYERGGL